MEQFFDILTIVIVVIIVFLLTAIAIHTSVKLVRTAIGKRSVLDKKDSAQSNGAGNAAVQCYVILRMKSEGSLFT